MSKGGGEFLFDEIRYFFYITNDCAASSAEIVFGCNDRCDQENLIAQIAGGARAWSALLLPVTPRHCESHEAARTT